MKVHFLVIIPVLVLYSFTGNIKAQQDQSPKEMFVEAESYFLFEEYTDALPLYQKILRLEPENYNVMYKIGICYLNNPYQKEKSIKYLSDASAHITKEFKINSFKEKLAPPEVNYYLAQAYRINGQLDKALEYYLLFKKNLDPLVFDINVVNDEIASCEVARKLIPSPVYLTMDNAGSEINSRFADVNPVLSGDGNTIAFTRLLQFYDGVFISKKDKNGNWSPPYNLTPDFGLDGNSYVTGLSFNGDEIFVYRSDNFDGNIYTSRLINDQWQVLTKLNDQINTKYWESHASPSPDGKYLYFTSNRKGGYGGLDIYRAPRISGNDWGTPVNLGPVVNSPYNEETPFISTDNQKLFFSSLGHNGMGGYDIFVSELSSPGSWTRPVNMGYPLNSTGDDLFFNPVGHKNFTGIYSTYAENSTNGMMDIYWIKVYNSVFPRNFSVTGKVNLPPQKKTENTVLTVTLIDSKANKIVEQVTTDSIGAFSLNAPQGEYQVLVDGQGIKPVSIPLALALTQDYSTVQLPEISTQLAAVGEDQLVVYPAVVPKLDVVGETTIITETSPVSIVLAVDAGNKITVENYAGGKLASQEAFVSSKNNFTYTLTPQPGDNRVVFTITDNNGNKNTEEVNVYYNAPVPEEPVTSKALLLAPTYLDEIAGLAPENLQNYLLSLNSLEFNSLSELYAMLSENADKNGYTQAEVDHLMAILLAQRSKGEFIDETKRHSELTPIYSNDSLVASSNLPIILVQQAKILSDSGAYFMDEQLLLVVPYSASTFNDPSYILSFVDTVPAPGNTIDPSNLYGSLAASIGADYASKAAELAATTANLDQFYLNLLASANSNDEFKPILLSINFDSLHIVNSIQLLDYLFNLAEQGKIDAVKLVAFIENANVRKPDNLIDFKEALANAATGNLKAHIQELTIPDESINSYSRIIEALLRDSKSKGFTQNEVYELLLGMLGIENVDSLIAAMRKYTHGNLDSLLMSVDASKFSRPVELIQYLLSEAPYFDFTDSDINNLLIRMLLERGLAVNAPDEISYIRELIRKNQFMTTIILANILIVIIIILFWRRKKKKEN